MQFTGNKNREGGQATTQEPEIDLNASLKQGEQYVRSLTAEAQKRVKEGAQQVKHIISDVDKRLHENPWPIVAGVAVGCVLLGYIMGANKKN